MTTLTLEDYQNNYDNLEREVEQAKDAFLETMFLDEEEEERLTQLINSAIDLGVYKKAYLYSQSQQENESLKAQLVQYQSDDCVLVPTAKINVAWQDTSEPENIVFNFSDLNMLGNCYDLGDLVEIEYYKSAYFNHQTVYGTWNKDKTHFFVGSKEECQAMIEAQEQDNE